MRNCLSVLIVLFSNVSFAQCDGTPKIYNHLITNAINIDSNSFRNYIPKIAYIGQYKDSIYVGVGTRIESELATHKIDFRTEYAKKIIQFNSANLGILLCKSNIIKVNVPIENNPFERKCINAYGIIIKNTDSVIVDISVREILEFAVEVQDKEKKWVTLIDKFFHGCITGDPHYFLKPNEIVLTTIPIPSFYKGPLRIKMGNNYSNTVNLYNE